MVLISFYVMLFESGDKVFRLERLRVLGLLTLIRRVGGGSNVGLLNGKASTERSSNRVISAPNSANITGGCWRESKHRIMNQEEFYIPPVHARFDGMATVMLKSCVLP